MNESKQFAITFPLLKTADKSGRWIIEGVASTQGEDVEGDIMLSKAIQKEIDSFISRGTLRWQHSPSNVPLGRVLELQVKPDGKTYFKAELSKVSDKARDIWNQLKEGVVYYGASLGGKIIDAAKEFDTKLKKTINKIYKIRLDEISLTDNPANRETWVVPSLAKALNSIAEPKIIKIRGNYYELLKAGKIRPIQGQMSMFNTTPLGGGYGIMSFEEQDKRRKEQSKYWIDHNLTSTWHEEEHPREPAGTSHGGEFKSKKESGTHAQGTEPQDKTETQSSNKHKLESEQLKPSTPPNLVDVPGRKRHIPGAVSPGTVEVHGETEEQIQEAIKKEIEENNRKKAEVKTLSIDQLIAEIKSKYLNDAPQYIKDSIKLRENCIAEIKNIENFPKHDIEIIRLKKERARYIKIIDDRLQTYLLNRRSEQPSQSEQQKPQDAYEKQKKELDEMRGEHYKDQAKDLISRIEKLQPPQTFQEAYKELKEQKAEAIQEVVKPKKFERKDYLEVKKLMDKNLDLATKENRTIDDRREEKANELKIIELTGSKNFKEAWRKFESMGHREFQRNWKNNATN